MKRGRILSIVVAVLMTGFGPVGLAEADTAPFGVLDPLTVNRDGTVQVRAWAVDPDDRSAQVPIHVYVDGGFAVATSTGTDPRPDVAAAFQAPTAGMGTTLPDAGSGPHTVCVFAINVGNQAANTLLGCRSYGVPLAPSGSFDRLQFFADGSPVVNGWAADGNDLNAPLQVHFWVDGVRAYSSGTGNDPRPDVAAAVGAPNAGFVSVLPPQGSGPHTICAFAINIGPDSPNTLLGCKSWGQPVSPIGALDRIAFFADGSPVVYGWATDGNDLQSRLGIVIRVDGVRDYGAGTGNDSRPDVATAIGAPNAGFVSVIPPQGGGQHTICAWAINIGPDSPNTELGCRTYGQPVSPIGSVDRVETFGDGSPVVYGWATDGSDPRSALDVVLRVDGSRDYTSGTGNNSRPDIAAAYGAPNAGFVAVLPPQGAGQHSVCGYAVNIGAYSDNGFMGCKTYTYNPSTFSGTDKVYRIGAELAPGTYRTRTAWPNTCYWERLSGFGGSFDEIIANDITSAPSVVTIKASDAGFRTSRCATWSSDLSPITANVTAAIGDGTYIVNTDTAPGLWAPSGGASCYWERLTGFGGSFDEIITNSFGSNGPVRIAATDKGFHSNGCGTWTKVG